MSFINKLSHRLLVPKRIEAQVDKMKPGSGSFDFDPWGRNFDTFKKSLGVFEFLYKHYFRVEAINIDLVPGSGRALIVANHAGQLPFDGIFIGIALALREKEPRIARAMVEHFFPTVPFIGSWLSSVGAAIGDPINCSRMLENEEAVIVFPEGVRGVGKLYDKRYQLQRFGNGFVHLAMNHNTPIIPVGIVGTEETMPSFYNIKPLAKILGVPYVPVTTPIPLPAQVKLYFGEPMHFKKVYKEKDVTAYTERVKTKIDELIQGGLKEREGFFK